MRLPGKRMSRRPSTRSRRCCEMIKEPCLHIYPQISFAGSENMTSLRRLVCRRTDEPPVSAAVGGAQSLVTEPPAGPEGHDATGLLHLLLAWHLLPSGEQEHGYQHGDAQVFLLEFRCGCEAK